VRLDAVGVKQSLEHVTPKHIGSDPLDGSNWAIACTSCNSGKADTFAWASASYAHDFLNRLDFSLPRLGLPQRWSVLMRDRHCVKCGKGPEDAELWVYRRVATGLMIPANCGTVCDTCVKTDTVAVLTPNWEEKEKARVVPV
jgi:hypothetical protein